MPKVKKSSRYPRRKTVKSTAINVHILPVQGSSSSKSEPKIMLVKESGGQVVAAKEAAKVCDMEQVSDVDLAHNYATVEQVSVEKEPKMFSSNKQTIEIDAEVFRIAQLIKSDLHWNMMEKKGLVENLIKEFKREINEKILEITNMDSEERQELANFINIRTIEVIEGNNKNIERLQDTDEKLQHSLNELQKQKAEIKQFHEEVLKKMESLAASKASRYLAVKENWNNDVLLLKSNFLKMVKKEEMAKLKKKYKKLLE